MLLLGVFSARAAIPCTATAGAGAGAGAVAATAAARGCYPARVLSDSREELGSCGKSAHEFALRYAYATPFYAASGKFRISFPPAI